MLAGETIVAIASAAGPAPRAVVRLSGPGALPAIELMAGGPPPIRAGAAAARFGPLPVLLTLYRGPRSYTGEDGAEILLTGNPHVSARLVERFLALPGLRLAQPGEFTARAFLNGKLTLEQAEGVAGTIAARTDEDLEAARRLLNGETGRTYRAWADEIATLLALVESGIDFTDQEDVRAIAPEALEHRIDTMVTAIGSTLGPSLPREASHALPSIVLVGAPNAGKSTLFNALLGRARSVVSPEAGTTRDVIREVLDLSRALPGAGPVVLADLAGLDSEADAPAQQAARAAIDGADAILLCDPGGRFELTTPADRPVLRVRTKADVPCPSSEGIPVCALDGWNLATLRRAIADAAFASRAATAAALLPRHRRALGEARRALIDARSLSGASPELTAGALREALDATCELTGRVSPDDVLGRIFATFCIGK